MSELIIPPLPLTVAISPCPNDTFIFGAWVLGQCDLFSDRAVSFIWEDVQVLNEAAVRKEHDVIKVSAAQALKLLDDYVLLPAGGAFSKVHGPKLVTAGSRPPADPPRTIAVPGLETTAATLLRQAWPEPAEFVPVRYDRIVDMVLHGEVDAGLLIHESALLSDRYGFSCILDLGRWWDGQTDGLPLPLGCILARRILGTETLERISAQIQASLNHASHAPDAVWPLVRALAQELDDEVLWIHIRTYVNHYSRNLGEEGARALEFLGGIINDAAYPSRTRRVPAAYPLLTRRPAPD